MRRILSILLLISLGLGPGATALSASVLSGLAAAWTGNVDESRLPACCRRNGKHHCAMGSQDGSPSSNSETSVSANDSCPYMPHALASTAPVSAALVATASGTIPLAIEAHAVHACEAAPTVSNRRNWPKRGPPALTVS